MSAMKKKKRTAPSSDPTFRYYCNFRVSLPNDPESIESDKARSEIADIVHDALLKISTKYPDMTLDYNAGYELADHINLPLVSLNNG